LVLSKRWASEFRKISESLARDRRLEWQWEPPDMASELKAGVEIGPPSSGPQLAARCYAAAA